MYLLGQVWCKVGLAQLLDGAINPSLVLKSDHLVTEDALALVYPQPKHVPLRAGH